MKHEITHSAEVSEIYKQFVNKIAQTDVYNHWLRMQTGLNSSTHAMEKALIKSTIDKYSSGGVNLDEPGSRSEIIADFIGDMLFTDPDALQDMLEQLDKPTRNKLVKWILELIDKIKAKFAKGDDKIYNELEALERQFTDMLKEVRKEIIIDKGIKHSTNDKIIDLSKNNELSKRIGALTGTAKYKVIKQYIREVLGDHSIIMSDGKKAVVDKSDANHISNGAWDKKTAEISEIKKLIEKAELYAEDKNPTHNKFNYFCYYKADVRYDGEVFSIYLNVGRAINNGSYHLYDITNKIRDTADRINGLERPKPNEGYALRNGISNRIISQNRHSVNDSVKNNLSKSDVKYSYAGENAKIANKTKLQAAINMEESGDFTVDEIRKATGWFRSYDKKWRFEIDDSKMQVKDVIFKDKGMTLDDIIDHKKLFDAYPQLRNIKIEISHDENFNENTGATYDPINKKIVLNGRFFDAQGKIWTENEAYFKPILIHEIQHAIQDIEGFATGASMAYWNIYKKNQLPSENDRLIELITEYNAILDKVDQYNKNGSNELFKYYNLRIDEHPTTKSIKSIEQQKELVECEKVIKQLGLEREYEQASLLIDEINNIHKKMHKRQQRSPKDLYYHTAGEIEANDVLNRLEYNEQERYAISPNINTQDVVFAEKEDIIRLLKNGETMQDNSQNIAEDASEISKRNFSYDELIKKDDLQGVIIKKSQQPNMVNGLIDVKYIETEVKKKCNTLKSNVGITYWTNVPDIGTNVEITNKSITHGFARPNDHRGNHSKPSAIINARVALAIPQILSNSIEVNRSQRGNNINVPYTHVLMGTVALEDSNGNLEYYAVRSMVQERKNQNPIFIKTNILGKLTSANAKKIDSPATRGGKTVALVGGRAYKYSVADLLNDVKDVFDDTFSEDVYKHFGVQRKDNTFSKNLKYSLPETDEINEKSLFKYTEEQYNSFGWVRYENIISHKMLQMLTSKIYELTEQKIWFHKTTDGQYIIPIGEDYGLYDVLVYVNDNYENPKISTVIKLADFVDEYLKESTWKEFLNESELTERKINSTIEDVQAIYGEESVIRFVPGDSTSFQTYEYSRKEGITGIENRGRNGNWTSNRNVASKSNGNQQRNSERDISYSVEEKEFNKNVAADLKRSAFSLPKEKYSLPETDEMLRKQNEQLQADNKNLRELVNLYKHVAGGEIKIVSVDKVARHLVKRNNIKGDRNELMRKLINLYKFISRGEDLSWESIKQKAEPVVTWLQEHAREESKIDEYSRDILSTLREMKVYLDEAQRKEVSAQFGTYGDFRKRLMGSIIIANEENAHTSLDQAWQELAEMYPDVFDARINSNDMPGMLFETVQMLRNGDFSIDQEQRYYNEAEKADLLNQVYEGYWDISETQTASDVMQNKIDALKIKHAKQMKALRTNKNKRIEGIKAETQNKMREGRKKTETRQKIKRVVNTLNSYLLNGNKKKHVPEWMQPAVAEALNLINMDTISAQERIDKLRAKLKENLSESERAKIEKSIANIHEMGERLNIRLIKLKNAYAEIQAAEDPLLAGSFDEVVESKIQEVIDTVGDTSIRKMTLQQLESVYDMFSMILTRVRDVNKAFAQNQKETITEIGQAVVSEIKSAGGEKEKQRAFVAQIKKFGWDLFKPIYAMRAIGSNTFTKLFQNIINGQGVWARDMEESKKFISHQKKKYGYAQWNFKKTYTFKSRTGSKFNLNLEQIMSIYAYSKRPQAHDHLMKGGITFAKDAVTEVKNKMGIVEKYEVNTSKAHNLDPQTIIDIVSVLTESQRQYVDVMQSYLSDIMGEKGNDVSMKLYGIKLFKEKSYFPLKSANYFITYEAGQTQEKRIKNSGMTKKTVAHANNPIVLDDFTKVWSSHVNEMSMYHSFVLPLEDFNRVFNYRTPSTTETETLSVVSTLVNAYGNGAESYIKTLLNDLNGGVRTDGSGLMDKLIGLSKKGAVMASASVVIQQPSAVMRAMAHINPKYFANMKYWIPKHKEKWDLIKKYAPVAVIKEMGRFDTGMGTGSVEWLMQDIPRNFAEKLEAFFKDGNYRDDVFGKMPSLADEFGWIQIWNAVEKEIAKTRRIRVRSEEFYKAVAERFSEVIELTQVYDSTLSRSGIMRKTDSGAKMLTAFMAEPTTQLNMLMDSLVQAKRAGGVKGVKIITGTTGAIIASMVLNAALKSFVMAARDDDEDETYIEKYISAFTGDALSSFNILNSVPIAKDIISIFEGYDVERLDMALFSDLKNAIYAIDDEKKSTTEKVMGLAGALAAFGGLPVKNVYRDIDSAFNFVETLFNGQKTTKSSVKAAFMEGADEGTLIGKALIDTTKTQKLYDAMMSDDEVYIERLRKQYKTESSFNSALYKGLRENDKRIEEAAHAIYEGDTEKYSDFIDEIVNEGHFDKGIVVGAIKSELRSWENSDNNSNSGEVITNDTGGETSIYDMSDVKMFLDAGQYDAAQTAIQDILKAKQKNYILQGEKESNALKKTKSSMKSSMTSYYKEKYIIAYKNKDEDEMLRIRKALTESGLYGSASDVRKTVVSWTKK